MGNTKIIAFANNKGGSGKSTSCSCIAAALSKRGKRVLAVDGDMQLNLTLSFFSEEKAFEFAKSDFNTYTLLTRNADVKSCIRRTEYENVDVLPSSTLMSGVEYELFSKWQRETIMRRAFEDLRKSGEYDYILLDAPPTLGCLVMNVLACADYLVIPLEASPWGLFGLANMFDFVETVKGINPALEVLGVLVTKVDTRKNYFKQTIEALENLGNVHVFKEVIRLDSAVEWAQDNSKPVVFYKPSSRASKEFESVAGEIEKLIGGV